MKARQRFSTARRRWLEGRIPLTSVLVGPAPTVTELQGLAALHADHVEHPSSIAELISALGATHEGRSSTLVLFELGEPHWSAFDAIRALRPTRGLHLVTSAPRPPHEAWTQVMPTQVECRLTDKELHVWVQITLGGALAVSATELLDRVGWNVEAAAVAMATVLAHTDKPNLGDIRQLVEPNPELHFVKALVHCDLRRARELVPRVTQLDDVLEELEHALMQLWAVGEIRPVNRLAHPRELTGFLSIEPERIKELAPLVRLYSRQKLAQRLGALAAVDRELRRGAPHEGLLSALCATW